MQKPCNGNAFVVCEEEREGPEWLERTTKMGGGSAREADRTSWGRELLLGNQMVVTSRVTSPSQQTGF